MEKFPPKDKALVLYVRIAITYRLLYCSWSVGCGEVYDNIIAANGPASYLSLVHPEQLGMVVRACPLGCYYLKWVYKCEFYH